MSALSFFGPAGKGPAAFNSQLSIKISSLDKHKIASHLLCLLLISGDMQLPISPIVVELAIAEKICSNLVQGLGCVITSVDQEQSVLLRSVKIARLVVGSKGARKFAVPRRNGKR